MPKLWHHSSTSLMAIRNLVEEDNNDRDDDDDKRREESWWQPLYWDSNIWVRWTDHLAGVSTYLSDSTVQVFVWYKLWPYLSDTSCTHICLIKAVQIFVWYKLYTYLCITNSTHICLTLVVHIFVSSHLYNNSTTKCLKYTYVQIANVTFDTWIKMIIFQYLPLIILQKQYNIAY